MEYQDEVESNTPLTPEEAVVRSSRMLEAFIDNQRLLFKSLEGIAVMQADLIDEIKKARKDIQELKTSQRGDKKRDWRILKMLKGGR